MAINNVPVIGAISLRKQGIRLRFCWFYSLFFMFLYSRYLAVMLRFPCLNMVKICSSYSRLCSLFSRLAFACAMINVKLCWVLRHFTRCFASFHVVFRRILHDEMAQTILPLILNNITTPN